jgi:hypothetical protein
MTTETVAEAPATTTLLTEPATTPEGATTTTPDAAAPAPADAPSTPETPAPDAPAAPAYEFALPDGVAIDAALLEQVAPVLQAANVPAEQAQALVSLYAQHVAAQDAARLEAQQQQVQAWADEVRADPEIGGAKLAATLNVAQRAIHRFGGDPLKQLLNETGLGNHPVLVRAFAAAGAAVSEDTTILPSTSAAPAEPPHPSRVLYPTMTPKE